MMNKEELIKAVDRIFNNCEEIDNHNSVEDRTGYNMLEDIKLLTNGINNLQQKIDKAIEYVKENINSNQPYMPLCLLEILGGKE